MLARARRIAAGCIRSVCGKGIAWRFFLKAAVKWTLTDAGCSLRARLMFDLSDADSDAGSLYPQRLRGPYPRSLPTRKKFEQLREILAECSAVRTRCDFEADGVKPDEAITLAELEQRGSALEAAQPQLVDEISIAPG